MNFSALCLPTATSPSGVGDALRNVVQVVLDSFKTSRNRPAFRVRSELPYGGCIAFKELDDLQVFRQLLDCAYLEISSKAKTPQALYWQGSYERSHFPGLQDVLTQLKSGGASVEIVIHSKAPNKKIQYERLKRTSERTVGVSLPIELYKKCVKVSEEKRTSISEVTRLACLNGLSALESALETQSSRKVLAHFEAILTADASSGSTKRWMLRLTREQFADVAIGASDLGLTIAKLAALCIASSMQTTSPETSDVR